MSAATKATEGTIEANGLQFQYQEWGDTRTKHAIIMLHGYAETKAMWEETAQDLSREYRVGRLGYHTGNR